jgi:hypothetical protein
MESCDWLTDWSSAHSFLIRKHFGFGVLFWIWRRGTVLSLLHGDPLPLGTHCFSAHNFHTVIYTNTLFCTCIYCFRQARKRLRASSALRGCVTYCYDHFAGAFAYVRWSRGVGFPHPLRLYIGAFRPSNYCSLERSYISWHLLYRFIYIIILILY